MKVDGLITILSKLPGDWEVIVTDGDAEYDVVLESGTDENLNPCAVIDLTADCERR